MEGTLLYILVSQYFGVFFRYTHTMDTRSLKLIAVLVACLAAVYASPLNLFNPQDEPDNEGLNSPTDEREPWSEGSGNR